MRHLEDRLQIACVRWFSMQHRDIAHLLHHSPNGGYRTATEGAKFKAMGVRAGFADLVLLVPRGGYHALFIEMKSAKGRQTALQEQWQHEVEAQGYKYTICRSIEEFINIITNYLKEKK